MKTKGQHYHVEEPFTMGAFFAAFIACMVGLMVLLESMQIKDGVAAHQLTPGKAVDVSSTAQAATPSDLPDPLQSFLFVKGSSTREDIAAKVFKVSQDWPNSKIVVVGRPDEDARGALLRASDFASFLVKAHPIDARRISVMVDGYAVDGCIEPLDYCAALRRGVDIYVTRGKP